MGRDEFVLVTSGTMQLQKALFMTAQTLSLLWLLIECTLHVSSDSQPFLLFQLPLLGNKHLVASITIPSKLTLQLPFLLSAVAGRLS